MKSSEGYVQAYNCQAMVDEEHQIIVAQAVTNQAPDVEHLVPMLAQTVANCGAIPDNLLADAGYFSEVNVCEVMKWGADPFIPARRQKHSEDPQPVLGRPPDDLGIKDKMLRKLATKIGRAIYALRKKIVEPVFGQIKEPRGFRRFLLRGTVKVRGEWALMTMTHNLLKIYRAQLHSALSGHLHVGPQAAVRVNSTTLQLSPPPEPSPPRSGGEASKPLCTTRS
jgi:hypothetical protein